MEEKELCVEGAIKLALEICIASINDYKDAYKRLICGNTKKKNGETPEETIQRVLKFANSNVFRITMDLNGFGELSPQEILDTAIAHM